MKPFYYTIAFLLEMGMFIAFFLWGYLQGATIVWKWCFALGLVTALVIFWGIFMSPKAPVRLSFAVKTGVEVILFLAATCILSRAGYKVAAIVFGTATVVKEVCSLVYGE